MNSQTGIKVEGIDQLKANIEKALLKHPEAKVRRALTKGAEPLVSSARANVKRSETGVLSESIRVLKKYGRDPMGVYVGPVFKRKRAASTDGKRPKGEKGNAWYAHFVEYGTDKHNLGYKGKYVSAKGSDHPGSKPYPFMRPAYDNTRGQVMEIMMKEIEKLVMNG